MIVTPHAPFGAVGLATGSHTLPQVPVTALMDAVARHGVLILRGFPPLPGNALPGFATTLGTILEWDFGAINHLEVRPDAKNYLFTNRAVPMHWDGAFVGRIPHYIFFACEAAPPPGSGGETTFVNTPALLASLSPEERAQWETISITYSTEKIVHYGGSFTSPLLATHPVDGRTILRYAEPVHDLNPVRQEIHGLPPDEQQAFIQRMETLLYDARFCYAHAWQTGDFVIADNFALLHGRNGFTADAARHIRRVNIL